MPDWLARLDADGIVLLRGVFSPAEVGAARRAVAAALGAAAGDAAVFAEPGSPPSGARDLLRLWPGTLELARSPALAGPLLAAVGPTAGVVRGHYFDKPPGAGWALPWHRDRAIAVAEVGVLGRFRRPTVKAGVPHVDAPDDVLAGVLAARIHLDPMTAENGPLKVIPGSHRDSGDRPAVRLSCDAGDVVLMRPLLLHASEACPPGHAGHRRTVHIECAPSPLLPDGYRWRDFAPIRESR